MKNEKKVRALKIEVFNFEDLAETGGVNDDTFVNVGKLQSLMDTSTMKALSRICIYFM